MYNIQFKFIYAALFTILHSLHAYKKMQNWKEYTAIEKN